MESAEFSPDGLQLITIAKHRAWLWRLDDDPLGWCIPQWDVSIACFTPDSKGVLLTCRTEMEEWDVEDFDVQQLQHNFANAQIKLPG